MSEVSAEVDIIVKRLFTMLGFGVPQTGAVTFEFNDGLLALVRPTTVIRIRRDKGLANRAQSAHTQQDMK